MFKKISFCLFFSCLSFGFSSLNSILEKTDEYNLDNSILLKIPYFNGVDIERVCIRKLSGGTNHSFVISSDALKVVLRMFGEGSPHIPRSAEVYNETVASHLEIAEKSLFFDPELNLLLKNYVTQDHVFNAECLDDLKKVANAIKTLHISGEKFKDRFTAFDIISALDAKLNCAALETLKGEDDFCELENEYFKLRDLLYKIPVIEVPCHNDFHTRNLILTPLDGIRIIDWELSGNNDPAWDLSYFSILSGLNVIQEECFFSFYECNNAIISRVHVYKPIVHVLLAKWLLSRISTLLIDEHRLEFENMYRKEVSAFKNSLKDASFLTALNFLKTKQTK